MIAPHIYPELDAFLDTWRRELGPPGHNLLFTQVPSLPPILLLPINLMLPAQQSCGCPSILLLPINFASCPSIRCCPSLIAIVPLNSLDGAAFCLEGSLHPLAS